MNIKNQIRYAVPQLRKLMKESVIDMTSPAELTERMTGIVFNSLILGREKHDGGNGCTYSEMKEAALGLYGSEALQSRPSPYFFEEIHLLLSNFTCVIAQRNDQAWSTFPLGRLYDTHRCTLSPDSLLRFAAEFDEVIPEIRESAERLWSERLAEKRADEIQHLTVDILVDKYLKSLGHKVSTVYKNRYVIIRIRLSRHCRIRTRIPLEDIATRIPELPLLIENQEAGFRKYGLDFRLE